MEDGGRGDLRWQGAQYNRRFLQMCSHHLIEPVGVHAGAGLEEGVGREPSWQSARPVIPPLASKSRAWTELNARLVDQCIAYARRTQDLEFKDLLTGRCSRTNGPVWMQLRGLFDGFVEEAVRATTTCLIMADPLATASTRAAAGGQRRGFARGA